MTPTGTDGGPPRRDPESDAMTGTLARFARPTGADLLGRTQEFFAWSEARREAGGWPFMRALNGAPGALVDTADSAGRSVVGLNFASTDYLGLASHPAVQAAATRAIADYGVHSACSPALQGETRVSLELADELADFLRTDNVLIFPTGWAAGFGAIVSLVRDYDYVLMDTLTHACLQQGALAATGNVKRHAHLDADRARERLKAIRKDHASAGILVITEGLFSMDSDTPRLAALQQACHDYEATLLVDVAHDLGQMGPEGTGQIGLQQMLGEIDLVMGAFSKTFASNGGFVAAKSESVTRYVAAYSSSWTFSTALSPVDASVVRETLRIIHSDEGDRLRGALRENVGVLRDTLAERELHCYGEPSSLVPVAVGREQVARVASGLLHERGLAVNLVEFPAVPLGAARFRMQAMATHTTDQARQAGTMIADALADAADVVGDLEPTAAAAI